MAAQDLKSILKEVQKTATAPQATLTAPQGAGMLLVEAARDPGEPGTEIRGQAEND